MNNPYIPQLAKIVEIRDETRDTKTFKFILIGEQKEFKFSPGQFNMISVFGIGEAPFSITSDPSEVTYFEHTIRAVGNVTKAIHKLKVNDIVGIRGPFGRGWPLDKAKGKDILIVAGGLGLAPLRPVILHILKHRSEFSELEVLYGARTPGDLLYKQELMNWLNRHDIILRLTVDMVPPGEKWDFRVGVVTILFDEIKIKPQNAIVFICGPEIMMRFATLGLLKLGFKPEQIYLSMERRMHCGIGKCGHCQIGSKFVCRDGPVFSYVDIKELKDDKIII